MSEFNPERVIKQMKPLLRNIGKKILAIRRSGNFEVQRKTRYTDIVTNGDKLAEKLIVNYIKKYYPGHRVRGEEGADVQSDSPYEWIIDPIDGTTNYQRGNNLFGISVGIYKNEAGVLGIMYFPALNELTSAIRGKGAFLNGRRVYMRGAGVGLRDALISAHISRGKEYIFKRLRECSMNVLNGGSFTGDSLRLLEGQIDAFVHTGASPYDVAAARIIVEEAGGTVSGVNLNDEKIPIILAKSERLVRELRKVIMHRKS